MKFLNTTFSLLTSIFSLIVLAGCVTTKNTKMNSPFFDIQWHRGCRGLMPENTIIGFTKAVDIGVTTLEMDVVITKDGQVVVSHDPFFSHEITSKKGVAITKDEEKRLNIYGMNYTDILQYDVGLIPHPKFPNQHKVAAVKPLLIDVIELIEIYTKANNLPAVQYNIETKCKPSTDNIFHPVPEKFVELLMDVIVKHNIEARTIVQSFDSRTLQIIQKQYPNIKTAYLIENISLTTLDNKLETLGFKPTIYSPAYQLVTQQLVKKCHSKGMQIIPWTVNDTSTMKRLIDWGVDGIISDYPNLLVALKQ